MHASPRAIRNITVWILHYIEFDSFSYTDMDPFNAVNEDKLVSTASLWRITKSVYKDTLTRPSDSPNFSSINYRISDWFPARSL